MSCISANSQRMHCKNRRQRRTIVWSAVVKMKVKSKLMVGGIADLINAIKVKMICVEINVLSCIVNDRGRKRQDNDITSWEKKQMQIGQTSR